MKYLIIFFLLISSANNSDHFQPLGPGHFYGAWKMEITASNLPVTYVKIITPKHFVLGVYNSENNNFIRAAGGTWQLTSKGIEETYEFDSNNTDNVGNKITYTIDGGHDSTPGELILLEGEQKQVWRQTDKGNSTLFGTWRITQRQRNGSMVAMRQGARKTWKVLSGNQFQWAAFNVDTKQFLGTGGGTYSTKDGKYIEQIEFFSRDNSRVGMQLQFDFEINDKDWHHKGFSSKGDPIYEIWSYQD